MTELPNGWRSPASGSSWGRAKSEEWVTAVSNADDFKVHLSHSHSTLSMHPASPALLYTQGSESFKREIGQDTLEMKVDGYLLLKVPQCWQKTFSAFRQYDIICRLSQKDFFLF